MKAMLIPKKKKKKIEHKEIKHHFLSANINFNAVLLFTSTREHYLETRNLFMFNIDCLL